MESDPKLLKRRRLLRERSAAHPRDDDDRPWPGWDGHDPEDDPDEDEDDD